MQKIPRVHIPLWGICIVYPSKVYVNRKKKESRLRDSPSEADRIATIFQTAEIYFIFWQHLRKTNHYFSTCMSFMHQSHCVVHLHKIKFARINLWNDVLCFNHTGNFLQLHLILHIQQRSRGC